MRRVTRRLSKFTSVCFLNTFLISYFASGIGVTVRVHQREVMGTVDQSVLLPVSYSTLTPGSTLQIQWGLFPGDTPFVRLTRSDCFPDPDRSGYNCSDHRETAPSYRDRVHLYPENGSLLLWDLQPSDSGDYVICVYSVGSSTPWRGNVTLTVYNKTDTESPAPSSTERAETSREFPAHRAALLLRGSIVGGVTVLGACLYLCILEYQREMLGLNNICLDWKMANGRQLAIPFLFVQFPPEEWRKMLSVLYECADNSVGFLNWILLNLSFGFGVEHLPPLIDDNAASEH
ncbi:uncharacterized protein LOC119976513 [Scyliorhinus canicula]|uniref:uncharacterized protein LOC119976513 n=1 Tax=Scyliorhinus canicula TaxID=7830 RepID=UPI0018F482BC|nr:uncharacterized protein LOC119976513 [Scyliorhinus canicula]